VAVDGSGRVTVAVVRVAVVGWQWVWKIKVAMSVTSAYKKIKIIYPNFLKKVAVAVAILTATQTPPKTTATPPKTPLS
jgi:hypothetical protein